MADFLVGMVGAEARVKQGAKLLFIGASPDGDLSPAREYAKIKAAINRTPSRAHWAMIPEHAATEDVLRTSLLSIRPEVLHVMTHHAENQFHLETNDTKERDYLSDQQLIDTIHAVYRYRDDTTVPLQLAVLNCCRTLEVAQRLVQEVEVQAAIGTSFDIRDSVAGVFSSNLLYFGLGVGSSVRTAFDCAQLAVVAHVKSEKSADGLDAADAEDLAREASRVFRLYEREGPIRG